MPLSILEMQPNYPTVCAGLMQPNYPTIYARSMSLTKPYVPMHSCAAMALRAMSDKNYTEVLMMQQRTETTMMMQLMQRR